MRVAAWFLLAMAALELVVRPFYIGKHIEVTPTGTVIQLLGAIPIVMVCGRVLGWW